MTTAADAPVRYLDLDSQHDRQVVVDREPGQYLGHPSTLLLEDGCTMLCVYPKGHGRGAIVYKRSTDGGLTWSPRLPTPESWVTSKETPTLHRVIDAAGRRRIIMFSGLYPCRMAVSEDDGQTWSELKSVGDWGGIVTMGSVIERHTGPGHYLAFFHDDGRFIADHDQRQTPPVMTLYQTISIDGGLTWSPPRAIYANREIHLCEPGAVRSPDGKQIALLLRENARRENSHIMFSDDEGETWSAPRPMPDSLNGDRHTARYAPDGRLFISFRRHSPRGKSAPFEGDWVAWVGSYQDLVDGRPGQYAVRLRDNKKGHDCAYPGVEVFPDGRIVSTTYGHWDAGQAPYILSVRLRLEDLDALSAMPAAERPPRPVRVSRIWDDARHSAFTDIVRYRGHYFCTFREGTGHVPGKDGADGKIRVLRSPDGKQWESAALLQSDGVDLRDPKLSVTPDDRLMCLCGGSVYDGETLLSRRTRVSFSTDGERFTAPQPVCIDPAIASKWDWLWRVTWHGESGWGVIYQPQPELEDWRLQMVKTTDGVHYDHVTALDVAGRPGETTLRFMPNGELLAMVRREGGNHFGFVGYSRPPYRDWQWSDMGFRLGGPNFIRLADGTLVFGSRNYPATGATTVLGVVTRDGDIEPVIELPSGGDTSYPGLLVVGDELWASYYSSHEQRTSVYLARVPLERFAPPPSGVRAHPPLFSTGHETIDGVDDARTRYAQFREPAVVVTGCGRLVALCQARHPSRWSDRSGQDIVCKHSDDGGETWSAARLVVSHGKQSIVPFGTVYDGQTDVIHVVYNLIGWEFDAPPVRGELDEQTCRQFHVRSADGGDTWSEPREITSVVQSHGAVAVIGAGEGIQLRRGPHQGRLIFAGGDFHDGKKVCCFYSDDHGETWKRSQLVPTLPGMRVQCETKLAELPDGRLILNNRAKGHRRRAFSEDGGETWTTLEEDPDLETVSCNGSLLAVKRPGQGQVALLCAMPVGPGRSRGTVYVSLDGGRTWPVKKLGVPRTFAYSSLFPLPDGRIGLAYESGVYHGGTYRDIRMVSFALDWLLAEAGQ